MHSTSASRVPKRSYTVTRVTLASRATASMEKGLPLTRTARAASRILVRVESTALGGRSSGRGAGTWLYSTLHSVYCKG